MQQPQSTYGLSGTSIPDSQRFGARPQPPPSGYTGSTFSSMHTPTSLFPEGVVSRAPFPLFRQNSRQFLLLDLPQGFVAGPSSAPERITAVYHHPPPTPALNVLGKRKTSPPAHEGASWAPPSTIPETAPMFARFDSPAMEVPVSMKRTYQFTTEMPTSGEDESAPSASKMTPSTQPKNQEPVSPRHSFQQQMAEDEEARPASVASKKTDAAQSSQQIAILRPITDQLGRRDFKEVNSNMIAKDESTFKGVEQVLFWDASTVIDCFKFKAPSPANVMHVVVCNSESTLTAVSNQMCHINNNRLVVVLSLGQRGIIFCTSLISSILGAQADRRIFFVLISENTTDFLPILSGLKRTRALSYLVNPQQLIDRGFDQIYTGIQEEVSVRLRMLLASKSGDEASAALAH